MKFLVTADLEYVSGHLRYGHLEGVVEAGSEEELKEMFKEDYFNERLDIIVDSFRIDDYGDIGEYEYEVIE